MIKLILVEDHTLVRAAMRLILRDYPEIEVIGEAGSGIEALQLIQELKPDMIILDFKLPDISAFEIIKKLRETNPDLKILIVTAVTNDLIPLQLLEAGAHGYMTKSAKSEELIKAIKTIASGQHMISPEIAKRLALLRVDHKSDSILHTLSDRETEVMMMIIRGMTVKEIAHELSIDPKTVHSFRSRIFEKLNIENDIELTFLAINHNLIVLDE